MLDELRELYPGKWDGGPPSCEIHGLIQHGGKTLKIEVLLRPDSAVSSVFLGGDCVATARASSAIDAVTRSLKATDP